MSQKLSTTPPAAPSLPTNLQPLVTNPEDVSRGVLCYDASSCSRWDRTWDDDPFILYWYCLLRLSIPKCTILISFIPSCHRLSSFQVHQMVSSSFQIQQKQTRTKRCYTSIRGALTYLRQVGTAQVPMHRHMGR